MKQVNILIQRKNEIEASIAAIENNITASNGVIFLKEVLNLLSGVGDHYVAGDYYACDRYYSAISGVKNIRVLDGEIYVKVTTPSGYLLPDSIRIRDNEYIVRFEKSTNFNSEVDY